MVYRRRSMRSRIRILKVLLLTGMLVAISCILSGCVIITDKEMEELNKKSSSGAGDIAGYVEEIWDSDIVTACSEKAVDCAEVMTNLTSDRVAYGEANGILKSVGLKDYYFAVKGTCKIIGSYNDSKKKNNLDCDIAPYDGEADFQIQAGPNVTGSIRDTLSPVSADHFLNQIEYAEYSKELNNKEYAVVLSEIDFYSAGDKEFNVEGVLLSQKDSALLTAIVLEEAVERQSVFLYCRGTQSCQEISRHDGLERN